MNELNVKLQAFLDANPKFKGKFVGYKKNRGGLGITRIDNDWFECDDYLIRFEDLIELLENESTPQSLLELQENSKEQIPEIAKRILKHAIKHASLPMMIRVIKDLHPTTVDEIRNHIHQIQNILVAEYIRYTDLKKELELY